VSLFVHVKGAVDERRIEQWLAGVYDARAAWVSDFREAQHSLGRAWYTHLEQDRAADYFANARASDALVEHHCPGLQATMRELAQAHCGSPVVPREGWCGAGIHVFPAHGLCARKGGDIHFDNEGLTPSQLRERVPAWTYVLMLQPAQSGGGLKIWDVGYRGSEAYEDDDLLRPSETIHYATGDLVVMESYRLHQIQPFAGATDRISATLHTAWTGDRFESWF
jgi:hypothetical protein